jgi:hypothetical protein
MGALHRSVCATALGAALACGCTATPLPEPPAATIDFSRVESPEVSPASNMITLTGDPGAGPPGKMLRVTNLDTEDPPVDVVIAGDGSFQISLPGSALDELRFHTRVGRERDLPADYVVGGGPVPDPARIGCVLLAPLQQQDFGFVSSGGAPAVHTLTLRNECAESLSVTAAALRRASTVFAFGAGAPTLPLDLAPGDNLAWPLEFSPSSAGDAEEIFLVELTYQGEPARYPITLYGDGT